MNPAARPSPFTLPLTTALPLERMFVVKLAGDGPGAPLRGRVEHVLTGRQHDFGSVRDLLAALHEDPPAPAPVQS